MERIKESIINRITSNHISRLLRKFEERFPGIDLDSEEFMKKEVKKEFWLYSLNIRKELFNREILEQDDQGRAFIPGKNL